MGKQLKYVLIIVCGLIASSQVFAAGTSSGLRGVLVDSQGTPISGEVVEVIHNPTGRTKTLTTTSNGIFQINGLNVGGPYTVKLLDSSQHKADEISDLFLQLGRTESIRLTANQGISQGETVTIVGNRTLAGSFRKGPSAEFGVSDIANTAAISRDIKSILKRDSKMIVDSTVNDGPALSIAGGNIRSNSLTVDGVKQNDDFGLNKNGYPGRRTPISLDAIEQLEVNIAPFDVTYGDFQGGNVNIVTKSGTNEWHGSAFYYRSDDSLIGDDSRGEDLNIGEFEEDAYGFTVGGPIVKDKFFVFASYEKFESTSPYQFTLDNQNGSVEANERIGITQADFDEIAQIARDVWNYDIGGYNVPKEESDEKILLKLDWYINDDHRTSLTYQDNEGNTVRDFWGETFPNIPWTTAESNRYNQAEEFEVFSLQVFSDWSDNFSTEINISNKESITAQDPLLGANFEQMLITTDNGGQLYIGPDQFRHANRLSNERFGFKFKGDYYVNDDHKLTFGLEREQIDIYNLFVFGSLGFVSYASVDDFANDAGFHIYQNALSGNPLDAVDEFQYDIDTFYLQDELSLSEQLTLTYGFRYSVYSNDDKPTLNNNFVDRHGYDNQENYDGLDLFEPRVGFNYTHDENTVIRGGFGLFGGGAPNVWLSNSYGNDGKRKVFTGCLVSGDACIDGAGGFSYTLAESLAEGGFSSDGDPNTAPNTNGDTNSIAKDFELPSSWKVNFAIERNQDLGFLGEDWILSTDFVIIDVKNGIRYHELNFQQEGTAPDGRPIYDNVAPFDLQLQNTHKGGGFVWSSSAYKRFETEGYGTFDFNLGYTYQDRTDVNPGNAFIAFEGYGMPANSDFQADTEFNSEFEVRHNIVSNITWSDTVFGDNLTTISLAYSGRSGRHYSHTMRTSGSFGGFPFADFADWDAFGSQSLYVPTGASDPLVTFANGFDTDAFFAYLEANDCAGTGGTISRRHSCTSSWINRYDLRFTQEIKFGGEQALEIVFDIENFANLLNDDWGRVQGYVQPFNTPIVDATIENGQYVYSNFTAPQQTVAKVPSVWKMQLGVRYKF